MEEIASRQQEKRAGEIFSAWSGAVAEHPVIITATVLALVFLFFSLAAPNFLSFFALTNILTFASVYGIVVVGVGALMITGEFDLSVGSNHALAGFVFIICLVEGIPPLFAMLIALIVATLAGLLNGVIVVGTGTPSFITTLGTMLVFRGIVHVLAGKELIAYAPESRPLLMTLLNAYVRPINDLFQPAGNLRMCSLWFVVFTVVVWLLLALAPFGNWAYAAGGNPSAALAQGVRVGRVKLISFMLSGFFSAGLAAVILVAQRNRMMELSGGGLELEAVGACVIGGISLYGGSGSIIGAALGMLTLKVIEQGLVLMQVPNIMFHGLLGLLIIGSVALSTFLRGEDL